MKVKELIEILSKMDQEAEVIKRNSEGCSECNPFGNDNHHDVYDVGEYDDFRWTCFSTPIKVVIL